MKKLKMLFMLVLVGLLAGCVGKTVVDDTPFDAVNLSGKGYTQKVDNFLVLHDASSSMLDDYQGVQKSVRAKNVALNMNETIPALPMQSGLRIIGPEQDSNVVETALIYGMTAYEAAGLEGAVNSIKTAGNTPISQPLTAAIDDLKDVKGPIAVIVISDGINTSEKSPVAAAENLKNAYGDRICIYTILIGDDAEGKKTLEDIANASKCGFATTEDAVATGQGMAGFVENVFLKKAVVKAAPVPAPLQYETITMDLMVEFDFDKNNILPREADKLDEFAAFMNKYPETTAVLEGHTDSRGSDEYNIKLSQKRAESTKKYLVEKINIAPSRLTTEGFGETRPVASNKTDKGRQENRRVVAVISTNVQK